MITLHYTLADAAGWAKFSGDYNPIHFDLKWVQAAGGEQLSVHGMRALLDAKQFASERFLHRSQDAQQRTKSAFIKCVVRLRSPLWNDKFYDLVARNKAGSVAILSTEEQQNCLTCQLSPLDSLNINVMDWEGSISSADMAKLQLSFPLYPMEMYEWQFMDAILFQYLIHDNSLLKQKDISKWLPEGATLKDIFSRYPIVQTHQEVIFDSDLLKKWSPMSKPNSMKIQILPALVMGDLASGLLISINIVGSYENKLISNSITLKVNALNR
ncbi:MaoC family dehydratase [Providencia rettgeri]|nr:MaoC family dehydratase [Providencia rettgeri]ELR5233727.1 MaoC family dehydratase [Providencia rettgeri]